MMLTDDELRAMLRAEAAAHRPDRAVILNRVTQTAMRNEAARRRAPRVRIAGAAAAVAAVIGGGGFAQWALAGGTGSSRPTPPPPPSSVSVAPPPVASSTPKPSASARSHRPSASTSSSPSTTGASPSAAAGASALWADGSVDVGGKTQASSVVTIRTSESLTALDVTIRLAKTAELVSRGGSQSVPGASVNSDVTEEASALVFHFTLSSGDTIAPGTYTFFARYTYAEGGRDAGADTYAATATSGSGAALNVTGDFG